MVLSFDLVSSLKTASIFPESLGLVLGVRHFPTSDCELNSLNIAMVRFGQRSSSVKPVVFPSACMSCPTACHKIHRARWWSCPICPTSSAAQGKTSACWEYGSSLDRHPLSQWRLEGNINQEAVCKKDLHWQDPWFCHSLHTGSSLFSTRSWDTCPAWISP